MTTLEKIQAQIQKLQHQADTLIAKKASAVLETIRDLMTKHGLTTSDIEAHTGGKKRGPKPGAKAALKRAAASIKYRDPKSGATWTGHGRAPGWIASAKDRTKFLVDGAALAATPVAAGKPNARSNGQPKGPQPAKYRDPKSGATWSGRGPAPAWLASAQDRTKFLIDGNTASAAAGVIAKKASAKKVVAKKTNAVAGTKAVTQKAVTQKAAAKKTVIAGKKVAAKKAPAKKTAVKKVASKKAAAVKEAPVTANEVTSDVAVAPVVA